MENIDSNEPRTYNWNLLVVFSATDVQPRWRGPSFNKRPADRIHFRKGQETRVAIQRKDTDEGYNIDWKSATLVNVDVTTEAEKPDLKLTSRQKGRNLVLATVTAADGDTETGTDKTETWVVTVASGSGELYRIIKSLDTY
ncbi:hypothetical protein HO133_003249 [Letharia lupina]|uniref:Uncharacterized protein n=1 Tax=Letharia lupina TaxID=560253 RepID=A0A8H6CB64_9LECA|nr:uncharacterized protein HO133_003249 [Letharia lupina]KAF6220118.1 hypothetical protein HO133_003249 [Letharia lupina]